MYTPQPLGNPTSRPVLRTYVLGALVVVGSLLAALVFAVLFGFGYGIRTTLMAAVLALIPLAFVLPVFIWLDRYEAEPWRYLVSAFLYGALGSTLLALVVNTVGGSVLVGYTDQESANTLTAVLIAPLSEETFKGAFLLLVLLVRRRHFNGIVDGVVYAGIVAGGFAFTENILYFARVYTETGAIVDTLLVFGLRGSSLFLHPIFTSMTGIGVGMAATSRSWGVRIIAPFLGWCLAVLLHGLWNLSASTGTFAGLVVGYGTGFVVFVAYIAFIIWARQREGKIIGQQLTAYVDAGWLTPGEVAMLASTGERRRARGWARRSGGSGAVRSMRAFQDMASELALLRARMQRRPPDQQTLERERALLEWLTLRRQQFSGRPIG